MKTKRPGSVSISDMASFKWPITAISSILHRLTGVLLFLAVPCSLWLLERSLSSGAEFEQVKTLLAGDVAKLFLWFILTGLSYHIIAGVKHLLMDTGIGESLEGGIFASRLVLVLGLITSVALGVWIW